MQREPSLLDRAAASSLGYLSLQTSQNYLDYLRHLGQTKGFGSDDQLRKRIYLDLMGVTELQRVRPDLQFKITSKLSTTN